MACVQTGSFSRAAETLFTTQSSVSKVIRSMEDELGTPLFERMSKGIRMTRTAEQIYPHALTVLEGIQRMQPVKKYTETETLSLSGNPSSWFADAFVRFYELHQEEKVHYHIYFADSREVAARVRERIDDMGFAYVMKDQLPAFQYFLSRNYLEFFSLGETDIAINSGGSCRRNLTEEEVDFSGLKLIQRFPDEFSPDNYWNITDSSGRTAAEAETVITTNSDDIMERILQFGNLVNISGGYLSGTSRRERAKGIRLLQSEKGIKFGYVKRKGEALSEAAAVFLEFLKEQLEEGSSPADL